MLQNELEALAIELKDSQKTHAQSQRELMADMEDALDAIDQDLIKYELETVHELHQVDKELS
jgi:hypothetical protein